jgi:fumarate hydratase class II
MGEMAVPDDALYGASTQRAVLNFPISGYPMPEDFLRGLALVKLACAVANRELGRLSAEKASAIGEVAREILDGGLRDQFPVDVFQTGSGTSTNTNMNEVIANRISQKQGQPLGAGRPVHPNDDVNLGQSSNDVIPTALHVSVAVALREKLAPALGLLERELEAKSRELADLVKIGRTHLMDATPLTLGQEFSGYARQVEKAVERTERVLAEHTGIAFVETRNHFEAQAGRDDAVEVAGYLVAMTASLTKIANDLRLLSSGPRCGLGEIRLPATQPGSSIMPGKVNPVMSEMLVQVCIYVQGLAHMVMLCGRDGHLELNVTVPLVAYALHQAIGCLANAVRVFAERCVRGLEADAERCADLVQRSLMLVTALSPHLGYDRAAEVAREALASGRTLREVVLERHLLDPETLDRALDPRRMTSP